MFGQNNGSQGGSQQGGFGSGTQDGGGFGGTQGGGGFGSGQTSGGGFGSGQTGGGGFGGTQGGGGFGGGTKGGGSFGGGQNDNSPMGGDDYGNGPQRPPKVPIKLIIVAILVGWTIVSIIMNPQAILRSLAILGVTIVFAMITMRMAGQQATNMFKFHTMSNDHGVRCPYCGSKSHSVRVERTRWSRDPSTMSGGRRAAESLARGCCVLSHGWTDRILKLFGSPLGADVPHVSKGICRDCRGTWHMRHGSYW